MSRLKRALVTGAVACVALTGLAGPAAAGVDPAMNQPSYWGKNCVKVEYTKAQVSRTYYVKANTKVIIKAGTVHHVFPAQKTGRMVTVPKDISFVITCPSVVVTPPPYVPPTNPYPPVNPYTT